MTKNHWLLRRFLFIVGPIFGMVFLLLGWILVWGFSVPLAKM